MTDELVRELRENSPTHGSLPFWSWNDRLEKDELISQIGNMESVGMKGFFMHARFGLETEYMSDEWFEMVKTCVDEAKKRGMEAWAYDENGWPSGFGGGELLKEEENRQSYLEYGVRDRFDPDALAVYREDKSGFTRMVSDDGAEGKYHCVWHRRSVSYTDILNEEVVAKFIRHTYEEYKKRLGDDFGKAMPGFFTDEPQYYRYGTPWSTVIPEKFSKKYGYDITDGLYLLFIDAPGYEKLRYDFHYLIHELYINSFIKQIYEWCEKNGCQITGHTIEEASIHGQLLCCGGVMPFYRWEHIPGMDWLHRPLKKDISPKQLGSAAAQTGKKKVISEMFAMCGWDVTPEELKNIADFQYVNGVNLTCQHLYPYSHRGERKRDYPAHYSAHNPWQEHLLDFNVYFDRLGYLLSLGTEHADTLVIHPVHNAYMYYVHSNRENTTSKNAAPVIKREDEKLEDLSDLLSDNQVAYHYGDETMLRDLGSVENGRIRLGECVYDRVVVPDVQTLDRSTAALLKEYLAQGGKLALAGETPRLIDARPADLSFIKPNITLSDIINSQDVTLRDEDGLNCPWIRIQTRITDKGRIIFITNVKKIPCGSLTLTIKACRGVSRLDLQTLKTSGVRGKRLDGGNLEVCFDMAPSESFVLVEDGSEPSSAPAAPAPRTFGVPSPVKLELLSPNALTLDRVRYSKNGVDFSGPIHIMELKDRLLSERYSGRLWLRYFFEIEKLPKSLRLCAEPMRDGKIAVNGVGVDPVPGGFLDKRFLTCDVMPYVRVGANEFTYSFDYFQSDYVYYVLYSGVSESLRNCLSFDTEIECAYLYGDFGVSTPGAWEDCDRLGRWYRGDFAVTQTPDRADPSELEKAGLPFFAGSVRLTFTHRFAPGDPAVLEPGGRYAVAQISVNGEPAAKLMFSHRSDLSEYLKEGDNEISVILTNSDRNLLGPHHHPKGENWDTGPRTFTNEGLWSNGEAPNYVKDRYCFVKFGVKGGENA